eukprot:scaffold1695_cov167-Amphora_coffeaeformis.AAC.11
MFQSRRLFAALTVVFFTQVVVQGDPNDTTTTTTTTATTASEFPGRLRHARVLKDFDMHMVDIPEDFDPELVTGFIAGAIFMLLLSCFLSCCCGCLCQRRREQYYYYADRGGYNNYNGGGVGPRWTLCDCLALACIWEICCDRRRGYESF